MESSVTMTRLVCLFIYNINMTAHWKMVSIAFDVSQRKFLQLCVCL